MLEAFRRFDDHEEEFKKEANGKVDFRKKEVKANYQRWLKQRYLDSFIACLGGYTATNGDTEIFDGFEFNQWFHSSFDKANAVAVLESADTGSVVVNGHPFRISADGLTVYQMNEQPRGVVVLFNRSAYLF